MSDLPLWCQLAGVAALVGGEADRIDNDPLKYAAATLTQLALRVQALEDRRTA